MNGVRFGLALCAGGLLAAGCGGSGSGGGGSSSTQPAATFAIPKIPIAWAQRARQVGGPSSALSVVVTFDDAGTGKQNVSVEADRNASPAAYTQTYMPTSTVQTGVESMHVRFYSSAGGLGSLVGEADASVSVSSNGTLLQASGAALGNIQASGTVAAVMVTGPSTGMVGSATPIVATALDSQKDMLSVSPGSFFYSVTNGTGAATIEGSRLKMEVKCIS